MNNQSLQKRKTWLERIRRTRRFYSFQKWVDTPNDEKISPFKVLKWIIDDVIYLIKWNINILMQLRSYGMAVKRYSGLSLTRQWMRMAYLVFVIQTDSNKFRHSHLFEEERWKKAHKFSYGRHRALHNGIEGFLYEEEKNLIINKYKFYQFCQEHSWDTPAVYAIFKKGQIIYPDNDKCFLPERDLFVKQLDGGEGRGAKYFTYENGAYRDSNGRFYDSERLLSYLICESKYKESLMVQEAKKNHFEWKRFSNGSLATCRIVTGRLPDNSSKIIPFFATLRMPVGNADADNYALGGMGSAINIETGTLGKALSAKPVNDRFAWDFHPDTGEKITGSTLYQWEEVARFAQEIHQKFRTLAVAWDIALTQNGLCVIEGNVLWGSDVIEAPANLPMYDTIYPVWFEDWIEILSKNQSSRPQ